MKDPLDFIEKLQQKSETERKTIAFFIVIVLMAVILGLWIVTFSIAPSEPNPASSGPSPFSLLWNFIKESVGQIYR